MISVNGTSSSFTTRICSSEQDFSQAYNVQHTVFVVNQNIPIEIINDFDKKHTHLLLLDESDIPVGTVRLIPLPDGQTKLGRLAVLKTHQGKGCGSILMKAAESAAKQVHNSNEVVLNSQVHAVEFYKKMGYKVIDQKEFEEGGVMHQKMIKTL